MASNLETRWFWGRASRSNLVPELTTGVPTKRLCPPGEPNKAMGQRVPDRRVVPT